MGFSGTFEDEEQVVRARRRRIGRNLALMILTDWF
jgi:hypothetical protein